MDTSDTSDNRPVRRSGRQPKRTDKLEEFLSTAKRALRKSAPPSLESDPPSQTPTDAETASEASFDGSTETKGLEERADSPKRRTRSSARQTTQTQSVGRQTRSKIQIKDDASSDSEVTNAQQKTDEKDEEKCEKSNEEMDNDSKITDKGDEKEQNDKASSDSKDVEQATEGTPASSAKRGPIRTYINKKRAANQDSSSNKTKPVAAKEKVKSSQAGQSGRQGEDIYDDDEEEDEEDDDDDESTTSSSDESDGGGYDPNALYCICRQKHNKRFMICCDRCEEWFHGDCVGITEARGRLMERNGEDYVCPNCTLKRSHLVKPATSNLSLNTDVGKSDATVPSTVPAVSAGAPEAALVASPAASSAALAGTEDKTADDQGIKGRIEKAINPTGKKRIKIFQPSLPTAAPKTDQTMAAKIVKTLTSMVAKTAAPAAAKTIQQPTTSADGQTAAPMSTVVASGAAKPTVKVVVPVAAKTTGQTAAPQAANVQVQTPVAANSSVPTTPSAAATQAVLVVVPTTSETVSSAAVSTADEMVETNVEVNTTSTVEEKPTEDASLPKCIGPGCENVAQPDSVYCGNDCILKHAAATMKTITVEPQPKDGSQKSKSTPKGGPAAGKRRTRGSRRDLDSDEDYQPDLDEDDEDEHAEERPPPPSTASWSSDHNYIAVTPEKTTPISATVLNKKSPLKEEKQREKEPTTDREKSPVPRSPKKKDKKSVPAKEPTKVSPRSKRALARSTSSKASRNSAAPPSKSSAKTKKPATPPAKTPSPYPSGPIHVTGALRVTKSNFTIPKKQQPQQKDSLSKSSSSPKVSSSAPSAASSHSSSKPKHSASSGPAPRSHVPPANHQMRQNIRRSLTDILFKRVSDSDDLKMTESEVARLCVVIEKEMYRICLNTDNKYKNKYRTLMFNLKDPKNKGLFYKVIGGEISPFRLVRLSSEELQSKEIAEWKKPIAPESASSRSHSKQGNGHDLQRLDTDEAPSSYDVNEHDEFGTSSVAPRQPAGEGASNMVDILLKDTTSEHRTHLFDLNCKICTGQKNEDEPASKRARLAKKPESRHEQHSSIMESVPSEIQPPISTAFPSAHPPGQRLMVPDLQPTPSQEDLSFQAPLVNIPPPILPTVSSVSITRRDPRVARHVPNVTSAVPEKAQLSAEPALVPVGAPVEVGTKTLLPMPTFTLPALTVPKPVKTNISEPPPEGETAIFLHGQEKIWKGFVHMQKVAKFMTNAYLVSGSFEHFKEDLPDTIHVEGRIPPSTVWDYVGKLKTSLSKELCLIRFQPTSEEEEVAYVSLFSYFSSRKRFGVVANSNRRIKDLYLIPLSSKDPLPAKLLPFDGPGLEPARPNLLLGLLICQKDRKRAGSQLESEEKRSKTQTKEADDLSKPQISVKDGQSPRQSADVSFSTTPPGSPPRTSSEASVSAKPSSSVASLLSSITAPSTVKEPPSSTGPTGTSAAVANPLQTILNSLFRKKKQDSDASNSPSDQTGDLSVQPATLLDPIVKQFAESSGNTKVEEDEDDRPYDPEEEYCPSENYSMAINPAEVTSKPVMSKPSEVAPDEEDDVAYDPEDDSIFDEVKSEIPAPTIVSDCASNPQKILENLKQIGEKMLEREGKMPVSSSMVDSSLTTNPLLVGSNLLQLGKKVEELVKTSSVAPVINQKRDPRQTRDPRQSSVSRVLSDDSEDKGDESPVADDCALPADQTPHGVELPESSVSPEKSPPQDEQKSETPPLMDSDTGEVSIPLLGEKVDPDVEVHFINTDDTSTELDKPIESELETNKFSVWPNAASILKHNLDSDDSQDTPFSNYHGEPSSISTVNSSIPVLTHSAMGDTHRRSESGFESEYSHRAETHPQLNYAPPRPAQGGHVGPPPMSIPPPMQGMPSIAALPPMQRPSLPLHGHLPVQVPPPTHGPPPMHGPPHVQGMPLHPDNNQQYGPRPTAFPPYQNQWPGSQQQQPLPQQQQPLPGPPPQGLPRGVPPPPFHLMNQRAPPPQMFDTSAPPIHMRQQDPPPGRFDGPNSFLPPGFAGPPPPFSFPENRGPPPAFTRAPLGRFDLNPPTHFSRLSGPPPAPYNDQVSQPSFASQLSDHTRRPLEHYNKDINSLNVSMDDHRNQFPLDDKGPPLGSVFRRPPLNHFENAGQGPSPLYRESFDEHGNRLSQDGRVQSPQPFGGSERYRFDKYSDEARPMHHSGALLPTPGEASLGLPSHMRVPSPERYRGDPWRDSPELRRRTSTAFDDPEPRTQDRVSRFDGGNKMLPGPSEERQRDVPEDRRRDREFSSAGRRSWDRGESLRWSRERDRGRDRSREREGERRGSDRREGDRRENDKREGDRRETDRRDGDRRESDRRDGDKRENDRREGPRREADKRENDRRESERREGDKKDGEGEKRDNEKRDDKKESERRDSDKREGERRGTERKESDRRESERRESERKEGERKESERQEGESERKESERRVSERRESERRESERKESERRRGDRNRSTDTDRHRDEDSDRRRDRDKERDRGRDRDSDKRDSDRDRTRNRDRERDRRRNRSRSRDGDRDRAKDRGRDRDGDRGKDKERDKDKSRDKDREHRERSRSREKREEKRDSKNEKNGSKTSEKEKDKVTS
ncbi:death-inducer obliterator 1-like [Synchiropus splendidus]|uniref:death-inducer obliterator 1-like n=1 Tax=Synchiropus splendidus TaxID=270530 RepID=UPI00237E5E4F|nr:death-inducer obliterator 1-like [Synchiropus splendidus]